MGTDFKCKRSVRAYRPHTRFFAPWYALNSKTVVSISCLSVRLQVEVSNVLVVNKTDLVDEAQLQVIRRLLCMCVRGRGMCK